ncbi:MAG TPA: ATP synthase F1 subunit gamma [Pseudomonadota bacterium]|nr:ATP synthase F1 subunit gamma [Pseudomonadota bacterium]
MPSLKAIRKRISSVKNTQKITKAMKMVSAAKLRRAQESVQAIRPYARRLGEIAHELAERLAAEPLAATAPPAAAPVTDGAGAGAEQSPPETPPAAQIQRILLGQNEQRIRLVVVSADRGLAGAYNSNIFRRTERFITEQKLLGHTVELVVLGKKGRDYFRRRPHKVISDLGGADPKTAAPRAKELGAALTTALLADQVDAVYVVYNEFKSAAAQSVRLERLLPISVKPSAPGATDEPQTIVDYIYEPGREEVLLHLLPLYLETELLRLLLEAIAAEQGARMSAMDNASRNAKEMISRLTLQYNRARQAAITKELMEIVGGAEALKG